MERTDWLLLLPVFWTLGLTLFILFLPELVVGPWTQAAWVIVYGTLGLVAPIAAVCLLFFTLR